MLKKRLAHSLAALATAALLVAAPQAAVADELACAVSDASLTWGVKDTFRSYVSGSIANGGWETGGNATYETPEFTWSAGEGEVSPDLKDGAVSFDGEIVFSGHEGMLRFELADPQIVFTEGRKGALHVTVAATDNALENEPEAERVDAAELDFASYLVAVDSNIEAQSVPVVLTEDGARVFNGAYGDYEAGDNLDDLAFSITVAGCDLQKISPEPLPGESEELPVVMALSVGIVAFVILGGAIWLLVRLGRRAS